MQESSTAQEKNLSQHENISFRAPLFPIHMHPDANILDNTPVFFCTFSHRRTTPTHNNKSMHHSLILLKTPLFILATKIVRSAEELFAIETSSGTDRIVHSTPHKHRQRHRQTTNTSSPNASRSSERDGGHFHLKQTKKRARCHYLKKGPPMVENTK